VVGGSLLFFASVAATGARSWSTFAAHIAMHDATPTTNRMGWKNAVAHSSAGRMELTREPAAEDEFARWKDIRVKTFAERKWLYYLGIAASLALLVHAARNLGTPSLAMALGVLPITAIVGLTCYDYSYFLMAALLSRARRSVEIALFAAAAISEVVVLKVRFPDERYVAETITFLLLAIGLAVLFARPCGPVGARGE
jgi:hypothetical protein